MEPEKLEEISRRISEILSCPFLFVNGGFRVLGVPFQESLRRRLAFET